MHPDSAALPSSPGTNASQAWAPRTVVAQLVEKLDPLCDRVTVRGTAATPSAAWSLAVHGAAGSLCALLGLLWPKVGVGALLLLASSCAAELNSGSGWLRLWVPRLPSRNLTAWTEPDRPKRLVFCLSYDDVKPPPRPRRLLAACSCALWLAALVGAIIRDILHLEAAILLGGSAAGFVLMSMLGAMGHKIWGDPRGLGPGLPWAEALLKRLQQAPPTHLGVVTLLTQGAAAQADGVASMLNYFRNILDPAQTWLVVLQAEPKALTRIDKEGLLKPQSACPVLTSLASLSSLPNGQDTTAAGQALAKGWNAVGVVGSPETTDEAVDFLEQIVRDLDQHIGKHPC